MIENKEQLKQQRPDLVETFENMSKEELLNQIQLECIDLLNLEKRVSLFMKECTNDMSKTNYTLESLKTLIDQRKQTELIDFCTYLREMEDNQDIINEIEM